MKGLCLAVKLVHLPEQIYKTYYGCKEVVILPFVAGIGHVDERVKFLSDDVVVTDEPSYKPILEEHGLTVLMLPNTKFGHETYANSLLVNGTLFMPVYNKPTDKEAIKVYEEQGLKVVPINSSTLSNKQPTTTMSSIPSVVTPAKSARKQQEEKVNKKTLCHQARPSYILFHLPRCEVARTMALRRIFHTIDN